MKKENETIDGRYAVSCPVRSGNPGAYGYAATSGTTFTQEERKLPFPDLVPKEVPFLMMDGNFPFLILPVQKAPLFQ